MPQSLRLRRGDVITHSFRPFPNAPVRADGRICEEAPSDDPGMILAAGLA
jgi:predicted amidohydrolase